jgi:FkbM family methyltransferase
MSFISYSQNCEDVMLHRALRNVKKGFYIDVGANDPVADSVTKALYDMGWHGINIEPIKRHWEDLCRDRPHDINLALAVGKERGTAEIFDAEIRGWATLAPSVREELINQGTTGATHKIETRTLKDICDEFNAVTIHFLKVDVEGYEKEVFEGADFSKYRPWIIVAEACRPNSQEFSYQEWEPILSKSGYDFAYFDGLNRYYVVREHTEIRAAFSAPPNIFDDFVRNDFHDLMNRRNALQAELETFRIRNESMKVENESARLEANKWWLSSGEFESRLKIANENLEGKSNVLTSLKAEHEARYRELGENKGELAKTKRELESARVDCAVKEKEAERAKGELASLQRAHTILTAEDETRIRELERSRDELARTQKVLEAVQVEFGVRQREVEVANVKLASYERDLLTLRVDQEVLGRELQSTKRDLVQNERTLEALQFEHEGRGNELEGSKIELEQAKLELVTLRIDHEKQSREIVVLNSKLVEVQQSVSWKITAPFRGASRIFRQLSRAIRGRSASIP